jgi:hypothetical protein
LRIGRFDAEIAADTALIALSDQLRRKSGRNNGWKRGQHRELQIDPMVVMELEGRHVEIGIPVADRLV